jgi:hypothetical protein
MNSTASPATSPGPRPPNSPYARDEIDAVEAAFLALLASPTVRKMLDDLKADDTRTLAEQRVIAEIPAPLPSLASRRRRSMLQVMLLACVEAPVGGQNSWFQLTSTPCFLMAPT